MRKGLGFVVFVAATVLFEFAIVGDGTAHADDEFFGEFSGEPSFQVISNDSTRPTFVLLEEFRFTDPNGFEWITPKGWEVDGASIPQAAWSFVGGPMSGRYLHASIIHDKYCDTRERTAHDTHRNFYYGMRTKGVSPAKARVMYWAVRTFGPSWKVVKIAISSGLTEPTEFKLVKESIAAPEISEDELKDLLEGLDPESSLDELDALSDTTRKNLGSEELQIEEPVLLPGEDGRRSERELEWPGNPLEDHF